MPSVYDWSTISADNGNSDAAINWSEGQPPSTVNNSARTMMQRVKELLNDLGGIAIVSGTANALTLAASSAFTSYQDGLRVSFRAVTKNTTTATLNVNSLGAKRIVQFTGAGEGPLSGGELQPACIYEAVYSTALNGSAGAWLLLNPTPAQTEVTGVIKAFGGAAVPVGYLSCNGAAVSRSTYSALFSAISTAWGAGNGTTTFNVPDLRNDFLRGASSTLTVGTKQSDDLKGHTHTGTTTNSGAHSHPIRGSVGDASNNEWVKLSGSSNTDDVNTASSGAHSHPFTTNSTGGTETRPRNGVVLFVIKT
jgi:microcystin-dependent protein